MDFERRKRALRSATLIARAARGLMVLGLVLGVLTGCLKPMTAPVPTGAAARQGTYDVTGRVDFGDRRAQATIEDDIAPGATVSVIDVLTGYTITSTRTDAKGAFVLRFTNGFKPGSGKLYFFEALKGLSAGTDQPNAVGADAPRIRTIATWQDGSWVTLSSLAGNRIDLNQTTTAVSIVVSLRGTTDRPVDAASLLGSIQLNTPDGSYPHKVVPPDPVLVPVAMIHRAIDLVADALAKNRDPVRWIQLASSDNTHETVTLPDAPFAISYLSPSSAAVLEEIALVGSNFGTPKEENQVAFTDDNGATVSATVTGVSPDLGRLTVEVPATAVTGTVYLTLRGKTLPGPIFNLAIRDGHSVVDPAGNVYMANAPMGTVSVARRLAGSDRYGISAVVGNLDQPSALTFGPEGYPMMYVACGGGTRQVFRADVSVANPVPVPVTSGTGVANPSGMAFRYSTGDLYLTDSTANALYKVASGSTAVGAVTLSGASLSKPHGLSFGPDGRLYVANSGGNDVLAIDLTTNSASVYLSGLSTPWGVAFDTRGALYVSNSAGNSVYRLPVTSAPGDAIVYGNLSSFASIPTPGGMDADATGYLFVADNGTNGLYRINQQAETQQVGIGLNYPTATWVDAEGKFVLTDTGRILKIDPTGLLTVFAEGLPTATGLVRDNRGNFYTYQNNLQAIVQVRQDGSSSPLILQLTDSAGSLLTIRNDKLYIRSTLSFDPPSTVYSGQGEVLEFTLTKDGSGNVIGATGPTQRLRTPIDQLASIARNNTTGVYYTVNPRTGTLFKVDKVGNSQANFTRLRTDLRLVNAQDLWVDSASGRIWVACWDGASTSGLYVYNSDGSDYNDFSASVDRPTHLVSDGTRLYVNSYVAAGSIHQLDLTTGAVVRTLTGFNYPRGFAFNAAQTTMYVNEWGLDRISRLDGYQSATTPITSLLSISDRQDIECVGTDLYVTGGAFVYRVYDNGTAWVLEGTPRREYYKTLLRIFRDSAGKLSLMGSGSQLYYYDAGNYTAFGGSLASAYGRYGYSGLFGDPTGAGLVTATGAYSFGLGGANISAFVTETLFDGNTFRSYHLNTNANLSGLATNGTDTVYVSAVNTGLIYQIKAGALTTLDPGPYTTLDRMYGGISYYNGKLYEAIYTKHWVDEIDATSGTRTTLLVGMVAPEL